MANLKHFNSTTGKWEEIKVSTKFKDLLNTVELTQDQNYVNIGITNYNPVEDVIFIFLNSTWLQKDQDYVINGGLLRIESKDGSNWSNGDTFNFVVLKNVDKDDLPSADGSLIQNGSITIAKLASSLQTYINKIGTAELATVADDLSGAVNELSSQMNDIPNQTYITEKAKTVDVNNALALKADKNNLDAEIINRTNAVSTEKTERQAEIAIERARINNFTTLAEGSTTGDRELIDARIGQDGITYANVGTATRTQFSKVNKNINTQFLIDIGTLTENSYISYTSGNIVTIQDSYRSSDYIDVQKYSKLLISVCFNASSGIAFYDKDKIYISGIGRGSNNWEDIIQIDVPTNAKYLRTCEYGNHVNRIMYINDRITNKTIQTTINNVTEINKDIGYNIPITTNTDGKYINSSLSPSTYEPYYYSSPIYLKKGETIQYYDKGVANLSVITECSEDGAQFLRTLAGLENVSGKWWKYTATKDMYVCLSGLKTNKGKYNISTMSLYKDNIDKFYDVLNTKNYDNNLLASFLRIGVIGDSLASGACVSKNQDGSLNYTDYYQYSWGQFMARKLGITVVNYSKGGESEKSWLYNQTRGLPKVLSVDEEPCQCYMIALGVNNSGTDIGTIDDIKDDYTQNPDTKYGNYGRIIQAITFKYPKVKFFMFTIPDWDGPYRQQMNTIIRDVANKFSNVYLVDLFKDYYEEFNGTFLKTCERAGHFNAIGYNHASNVIIKACNKVIINNYTDFLQVEFINTDSRWY